MQRPTLHLFLILLLSVPSWAQTESYEPTSLLSQASIHQWTGDNGLISNNITSSIQARTGFIWITTYNGIIRFDGKSVEVFDRNNLPFLSTDAFYRVYEDNAGALWFASQGSGVVKFDGKRFIPIDSAKKILPKSIRCLYIENNGSVWVGSNNEGLFKIDGDSIYRVDNSLINSSTISDLTKDNSNALWIGTEGNGVIKYDGTQFEHFTTEQGLLSNSINTLSVSSDKQILIGTSDGLNVYTGEKITTPDYLRNIPVNKIINDNYGRIWIATENGLARISKGKRYEFVGEHDSFPFARINDLNFDKEGSLWLSTGRSGLIQVKETGIVNFTTAQGLSMNRINIVVEGPDKAFYIGTDAGDVNIYKNGEIKNVTIKTTLNKAGIRDILPEPNGDLWIASYEGILKVSGGKEKLLTTADGLPANDMRRVLRDKRGNLWFACRTAGVMKYENGRVVASYNKNNGLSSNYVLSVEEDANGNLYVGTHSGGMTIIHPDGSTKTFHVSENDAGVLIFNIHIETNGSAWLVCNTGPHYFDGEKIKKVELKGLQMGETYFDWLEDANGNGWITTNIGVLKIDRQEIEKYKQGATTSLSAKLYDNDDGMKSKECSGATRSTVSAAGKLWIPTLGGISVFYPEKLKDNKIIPPVYVTSIRTDDAVYTVDGTEVQPGNLRYIFNYTALSYLAPAKIQFKYKLDGIDPDWQDAKTKREAEYTNLPPGKYTFRVIGTNNDGVWNEEGATMHITVLPFFYQTYWFYAVTAFTILLIFYATYKWRISRIEKRNAELRKLNSELDSFVYSTSHDLRAPLASVLGLINLSRLEDKNKEHYINLIEKSVKKLDRFINEIIDYSRNARLDINATPINFKKIIDEIFEDLEYLEEKNHISTNVEIIGDVPLNSDETRIAIILRNLISNAIKYYNPSNAAPYLKIHVSTDENYGTILVMDNGIGIDPTRQKDIFKMFYRGSDKSSGSGLGLYIVKESVEKLGGRISVQSKIGEGSTFKVVLPSLTTEIKKS